MSHPYISADKWYWVLRTLQKMLKEVECIKCNGGGGGGGGGTPSGPAGGALSGNYPNPTLAANSVGTNTISTGAVTDIKIANRAALSVMGRALNSSGVVADITAGTDGYVLRRSGTTLGFGTVATGGITNDAVTNTKLANMGANTIKGRLNTLGDPQDLTVAEVITMLGLKTVATSGSYNDLTDKPTIPSAATWGSIGGTLSNQTDLKTALDGKLSIGGDTLGSPVSLGTNDNQPINFRINNDVRFRATNWFANYGILHPSQTTGIVFANNSLRFPLSGDVIFYPSGSASLNVLRYTNNGLAVGYADGATISNKLQVNGSSLLEGGSTIIRGSSTATGNALAIQNSASTQIAAFANNGSVQINNLSGTGTRMVVASNTGVLSTQPIGGLTWVKDKFTGSTNTSYNLSKTDISENSEFVFINGLLQDEGTDYSIDYDTGILTLGFTPDSDDIIIVKYTY